MDYFSSIATNQTFNTNINDASRSQRNFGGNVVGAWGSYALNGTIDHSEYFYSQTSSAVSGSWPRVSVTRNERPIQGNPFYFSASGEYVSIIERSSGRRLGESQSGPDAPRLQPADSVSVQEVAVVHRELDGELARHLLLAKP